MKAMKAASKGQSGEKQVEGKDIKFIVYACDAGMGSSALGAAALRKKLQKDGYKSITVKNFAIGSIPKDAQIVVSHEKLAERAKADSPQAEHIWVKDFTNNNVYDIISERLKGGGIEAPAPDAGGAEEETTSLKEGVLLKENVKVGLKSVSKEEAMDIINETKNNGTEIYYILKEKESKKNSGKKKIPKSDNYKSEYLSQKNIMNLKAPKVPINYKQIFNIDKNTIQKEIGDKEYIEDILKDKYKKNKEFKEISVISHDKLLHLITNKNMYNIQESKSKYNKLSITERFRHKYLTTVYFFPKK